MSYDFDTIVDRHGTGSLKYDCAVARGKDPALLPLWVADMDFRTPPEVTEAIVARAGHGIFGYSEPDAAYLAAVRGWLWERHGYAPEDEWLVVTPGVVFALAAAVRAYTAPGEAVLIQPPVYYPFAEVVRDNGRTLVEAPLTRGADGSYGVDLEAFERAIVENDVRLFLLCSPHNPIGRVWTEGELRAMGDVCLRHGVIVVADEIHADFARAGHPHTCYPTLGERYARGCVLCTSASKSFNLAGLQTANVFVEDPGLRARLRHEVGAAGYSQANALGLVATQAAYDHGGGWLAELKAYLDRNYSLLLDVLAERAPELAVTELEGTYLAWVDCGALGLDDAGLDRLVEEDARLWLDMGHAFGPQGSGFVRINLACPRAVLREACESLADACRRALDDRTC